MKYTTLNSYLKEKFHTKVYKVSLDAGFTCPNRDGTLDTRGCIFCSKGGSGDFAESRNLSITEQIEKGKQRVNNKIKDGKYIAYFQAFTNTYAPVDVLKQKYYEALSHPDVVALSIATRPDCINRETINLLDKINQVKPVFIELGLQTSNEKTAKYIRRGYKNEIYEKAVFALHKININVVTHIILGLPDENEDDMLNSVIYACKFTDGIKLQLLHILKGTDLADEYYSKKFEVMTLNEYADLIAKCIKIIPNNIVIHRLTGDGAKKDLIAPMWSADKKKVLNTINKRLNEE